MSCQFCRSTAAFRRSRRRRRPRRTRSMSRTRRTTPSRCSIPRRSQVTRPSRSAAGRAAITISPDGKWLYVCASDDNRVEVIDTATRKVVRSLKSGPDPELFVLAPTGNPLYIANEDDNQVTVVDVEKNIVARRGAGRGRAGGHGPQPGRKGAGQHVGNHQHGPFHRHDEPTRSPTTSSSTRGRASPSSRRTARRSGSPSEVGGTVSVIDPGDAPDRQEDHIQDPGRAGRGDPAGRRPPHQGQQASVRGARTREPRRGGQRRDHGNPGNDRMLQMFVRKKPAKQPAGEAGK